MHGIRGSFRTALLALTLALVLPAVVFMFGAVRHRQLQSKANPRWAEFARVTGPTADRADAAIATNSDSDQRDPRTKGDDHQFEMKIPNFGSLDLTGSVSGHTSVEMPTHTKVGGTADEEKAETASPTLYDEPVTTVPRQTIVFRPVDEEDGAANKEFTQRIEKQLGDVRRRLEQLARQQASLQQDGVQQRSALMEREAEFLDALKKISERPPSQPVVVEVRSSETPMAQAVPAAEVRATEHSHGEPALANDVPDPTSEPVVAESKLPYDLPPSPKVFETVRESAPVEPRLDEPATIPPPAPSVSTKAAAPIRIADARKEFDQPGSATVSNASTSDDDPIQIHRLESRGSSDRYTMEARDVSLRSFLSKLSEVSRVSIMPSASVDGTVSLSLYEVSFDSALKAVLKSHNLVYERQDDIVLISTTDEVMRIKRQNRQLAMRIYQPNYLGTSELIRFIEPLLSEDGRHSVAPPAKRSLGEGEPSLEESPSHRDAVIVQDTPEVLAKIDQVMVDMDVPPLQVQIEAKILCVRLSEGSRHGVDLSLLPCRRDELISPAEGGLKTAGLACDVATFMKSVERLADTNVVATQQIQVLNKQRAEMLVGDRVGIHSKSGEALGIVGAGTRLIFRPSISADGAVRLEIHPERSTLSLPKNASVPTQNVTELTTQVLVRDGGSVVIGGLIAEQLVSKPNRSSVVANPFRQRGEQRQTTELLIVVTPHIVTDAGCEPINSISELPEQSASAGPRQTRSARTNLAQAHYKRASGYYQQGNLIRARQQVEASLRQNNSDRDAVRLRNKIEQCLYETPSK